MYILNLPDQYLEKSMSIQRFDFAKEKEYNLQKKNQDTAISNSDFFLTQQKYGIEISLSHLIFSTSLRLATWV